MTKKTNSSDEQKNGIDLLIEKFQNKHELITKRNFFQVTKKQLEDVAIIDSDVFETSESEPLKLKLSRGYKSDIVSISNPLIIRDVVQFILGLIETKMQSIDNEILAD
jgi:hypothetical protein